MTKSLWRSKGKPDIEKVGVPDRSSQSLDGKAEGLEDDGSDDTSFLPTPRDLAASFLADEPAEERQQLEAALNSRSVDLKLSATSSEASDDDYATGLGVGLGVPGFLAAFLKGVRDRLEIIVKDISFKLDAHLEMPSDENIKASDQRFVFQSTFCIAIESINVRAAPLADGGDREMLPQEVSKEVRIQNRGKRQIEISGILFSLISDPANFAQLSHIFERVDVLNQSPKRSNMFSVHSQSSAQSRTPTEEQRRPSEAPSVVLSTDRVIERLRSFEPSDEFRREPTSPESFSSLKSSISSTDNTNAASMFASTASVNDTMSMRVGQENAASTSLRRHDPLKSFREERVTGLSTHDMSERASTETQPRHELNFMSSPSQAEDALALDDTEQCFAMESDHQGGRKRDAREFAGDEDLTESKFFSHDEAESIYMSALHEPTYSTHAQPRVPGAWDDTERIDVPSQDPQVASQSSTLPDSSVTTQGLQANDFNPVEHPSATDAIPVKQDSPGDFDISFCGPNAVVREIAWISHISLDHTEGESFAFETEQKVDKSTTSSPLSTGRHNMPGTFSLYAESTASLNRNTSQRYDNSSSRVEDVLRGPDNSPQTAWNIIIGCTEAQLDFAASRLLIQLSRKVQRGLTSRSDGEAKPQATAAVQLSQSKTSMSMMWQSLRLVFVDSLHSTSPILEPISKAYSAIPRMNDVLFALNLSTMSIEIPQLEGLQRMTCRVGSFRFGFPDSDIVSFGTEMPLSASVKGTKEVDGPAVELEISRIQENVEFNLTTRPVHIDLDIHKIDSTLGTIGGLSGLLEIGSSIVSDSTIVNKRVPAPNPSRTVRFEASAKSLNEISSRKSPRLNIRIRGSLIRLQGYSCSARLLTTAIKIVSRSSLIGLQISEMKLSGPFAASGVSDAGLSVRIIDTRLKYLKTPEEHDLTRLISLLTPSKDKFEEADDFLVDTLVRQRKKGAVLRLNFAKILINCKRLDQMRLLEALSQEVSKLSSVTRYLPEETRPGLMILALVDKIVTEAETGAKLGLICLELESTEMAHVSAPALVAVTSGKILVRKDEKTELLTAVLPAAATGEQPMLMARMIEDDLEPCLRVKLWNMCIEYSVPLALAFLTDCPDASQEQVVIDLAASITSFMPKREDASLISSPIAARSEQSRAEEKPLRLDIVLRDCALGLNPLDMPSKAIFMMNDAAVDGTLPDEQGLRVSLELRKAELLLVDDVSKTEKSSLTSGRSDRTSLLPSLAGTLCLRGFVPVSSISSAKVDVAVARDVPDRPHRIVINFKDELFVLETCADSTQTLVDTLNALKPPLPPSEGQKYRTEVSPMEDMMASFSGDAFAFRQKTTRQDSNKDLFDVEEEADEDGEYADGSVDEEFLPFNDETDVSEDFRSDPGDDAFEESIYGDLGLSGLEGSGMNDLDPLANQNALRLAPSRRNEEITGSIHPLELPPRAQAIAKRWDSANNRYLAVSTNELRRCPIEVHVQETHIIWNLYDGYDWEATRESITKAVKDVELRAEEKRQSHRIITEEEQDDESVIGDFLFNSIYIGIPANHDPKELSRQINRDIDDLASETASHAASHTASHASSATARPSSSQSPRISGRRLRLERSKRHKIAFEIRGLSADTYIFEPGGESQSSTDVRVQDFEIFDHVPTSTWKKFLTYMHDSGPREDKKPMLHLEICDVRPVPELTATELVARVTILPLRLHVDQDALDFITRFFEFKDDTNAPKGASGEEPYLQRVEVRPIPVKLDYKPKKVDYAGLRSGRTNEFMNFFILDGAEFVLRHVIIYGCSGMLKLHHSLEDVWMPDVKKNQLPSVLSGLNGVRTLVNVGSGVRDLIQIPIEEYRKDGRIVRSISKGASSFVRITGGELTRFGARLAIGAQAALQGAEGFLASPATRQDARLEEDELEPQERRAISQYANQPMGILQGLKGAARSLERDLLVAKDVIIAISGEARDSGTAEGVARAFARQGATVILRPIIGVSKAMSQTLLGATNTIDPQNRRRVEDVSIYPRLETLRSMANRASEIQALLGT